MAVRELHSTQGHQRILNSRYVEANKKLKVGWEYLYYSDNIHSIVIIGCTDTQPIGLISHCESETKTLSMMNKNIFI